jgi:receptor protein-tyrosine kinase
VSAEPTSTNATGTTDAATEILRVLKQRWWIPLTCALACAAGALLVTSRAQPRYTATSRIVFRQFGVGTALFGSAVVAPTIDPARELATNTELIKSSTVARGVIRTLHLRMTPDELLARVSVENESSSDIADITVASDNAADAAQIANAYAEQAVVTRREADQAKVAYAKALLTQRLAGLPRSQAAQRRELADAVAKLVELEAVQTGNAEVASAAAVPTEAVAQHPGRAAAIGGLMGLALGIALAFGLERVDPRLKSADEIEERYGLSVLARVPRRGQSAHSARAYREAFRLLAAMLRLASGKEGVRAIAVTSAGHKEGKTTVAFELALAAAEAGQRVVLMEGDPSRQTLSGLVHDSLEDDGGRHAGRPSRRGLTDYLAGRATVNDVVKKTSNPGLSFVPGGTIGAPALMRLLEGQRGRSFLTKLAAWPTARRPATKGTAAEGARSAVAELPRQQNGRASRGLPTLVIIDCAPVGSSAEAVVLAARADAVLFVVDLTRAPARAIESALRRFTAGNIRVLGAVVNRDPTSTTVYRERPERASAVGRPGLGRFEVGRRSSVE